MTPPTPTWICHITHYRNLPQILASGGLLTCAELRCREIGYCDVADTGIQDRRATWPVPCGPGGVVHDYVPFYFAPRSPMLFRLHKDAELCPDGQESIIHLVSSTQSVYRAHHPCVFTDGHATMKLSQFFTDPVDLTQIDWDVMRSQYWTDTPDHPGRKRRRQAEFLVHRHLPWELVAGICVRTSAAQARVIQTLERAEYRPPVVLRPNYYY